MKHFRIDIVSDVSCPWCIIGYQALNQALDNLAEEVSAEIHWQPFELNPHMPQGGQDIDEHLTQKYGITVEQAHQNREMIKQRGQALDYQFGVRGNGKIYNTFDAHRLLHWAAEKNQQTALKLALFDLYFQQGGNPSDHQQLLQVVDLVGLDRAEAQGILSSDKFEQEVRNAQQFYQQQGINSVPAVIIDKKHLISGGQPVDVFEQALNQLAKA